MGKLEYFRNLGAFRLTSLTNQFIMKNNRRKFVQMAGTLTAGSLLLPSFGCNSDKTKGATSPTPTVKTPEEFKLDKFGIQLYSLKEDFAKDPRGVLAKVSEFGYRQVEGYEIDRGLWWDMAPLEFKEYLVDIDVEMVSSHCDINTDFEKKADEAAQVGLEYLICPWVGPQKTKEAWKEVTDKFNKCGAICKKAGIKFGYHNHAYSFKAFSGMIPHDFIMDNTDPELVDHEMDIYWVVTGGADPTEYLKKYSNRFKLCHIKDRMPDTDERMASTNLGTGIIDYPSILPVAAANGMKYYFAEQERYEGTTALESAKLNANYLRGLRG